MAINKVIYNGNTLIDLTDLDVTADKVAVGVKAIDKAGNFIIGTMEEGEANLEGFSGFSGLYGTVELDDSKINVNTSDSNNIFVATNGLDTYEGTFNRPYKTISKALNVATAGKTIYVREGTYNESITFNRSGTEGNPITLRNYPDETVWVSASGISGLEAIISFNGKSYINMIGINHKNITETTMSVYGTLMVGGEHHNIVANCEVTNVSAKSAANGNAGAIKIYGLSTTPISNILVQNCHIHDNLTGWSEALTATSNCQYIDFIGNKIHDNGNIGIDVAGNFGDNTPDLDHVLYAYVAYNKVYNCSSPNADCAGIYSDGSSYVIFDSNEVYNCQIGMALGQEETSTVSNASHNCIAINNLIHDNLVRSFEFGASNENNSTYNAYILNNTIIHPATADDCAFKLNVFDGAYICNNIIVDKGTWNMFIDSDYDATKIKNYQFKNNLLYQLNGESIGNYIKIAGTYYNTTSFQNASFTSGNIITNNYGLNTDFELEEGSPCIDAGYDISSYLSSYPNLINYDKNKNKRVINEIDIGAIEFEENESGGNRKNIQVYQGYDTSTSTSYEATSVSLTVKKTGVYTVSWMGYRNTTSGTSGSQLYIGSSAYGSANTTFVNSYGQNVNLTNVSLTAGQTITVRAKARSSSYVMCVGNLCIVEN